MAASGASNQSGAVQRRGLGVAVAVETLARLLAQQPGGEALGGDGAGAVAGLLVILAVDGFHHRVRDVQPGQVQQLEGAEAEAGGAAQHGVHLFEAGDGFLHDAQRFGEVAAPCVVDDEAGRVGSLHGRVADKAHEPCERLLGLGACERAGDHFHHFHQRHGIEEVAARDAVRQARAGGNGSYRQRGGIGGQHALVADDGVQRIEQRALGVQLFDDGFDDNVAAGQRVQRGRCAQLLSGRVGGGCGELAFAGQRGELLSHGGHGLGGGAVLHVVQQHGDAGLRGHLRDAASHGAGAGHAEREPAWLGGRSRRACRLPCHAASGTMAVTSISTLASSSIRPATCTAVMAGKWRPNTAR